VDALDASGVPAATAAGASGSNEGTKESKPRKQKKNKRPPPPEPCSPEDVVAHDVAAVLGEDAMKAAVAAGAEWDAPFSFKDEVVLEVKALSSHGEFSISDIKI
jgi:tRNA (uracil-5-)-methyltransferase